MKRQFLLVFLLASLSNFVCGMEDLSIVDPTKLIGNVSPSSNFYYRQTYGVYSPNTTSVDFDTKVVIGKEKKSENVVGVVVLGREVKARKKVTFAPGTKLAQEEPQIGILGALINYFLSL